MKTFDYATPFSSDEAIALVSAEIENAKVLAGGTDLLVQMMTGKISPKLLVSLKNIPRLREIEKEEDGIRIGACCNLFEIENSPLIKQKYKIVSQACGTVGSLQVRCRATIGGNLCNASPAADTAAPLLVLGAEVIIEGPRGIRKADINDFFIGPNQTIIRKDEILTAIRIPDIKSEGMGVYMKMGRRKAMEIAIVGVAIYVTFDSLDKTIKDVKIGLSSVAPTPIRTLEAESIIKGLKPNMKLIEKAAEVASEASNPITDIRGSKEYRKEMVKVLTRRALAEILSNKR